MKRFAFFFFLNSLVAMSFGQVKCNFQTPCSLVMPIGDSSAWQIGTATTPFFSSFWTSSKGIITDPIGMYGINRHDSFDVHISNGAGVSVLFQFEHLFDTDSLSDGGYVEVSYDEGKTWKDLREPDTVFAPIAVYTFSAGFSPLPNGKLGFSGNSKEIITTAYHWDWVKVLKNAPPYTYLRFHFISDENPDNKEGWMIHSMEVSYPQAGGFGNLSSDLGIKVFPNPSSGIYQIDASTLSDEPFSLQVYDLQGKVLLESHADNPATELDLRPFDGKLFLYRIVTEDGRVQSGRLVKE